MRFKQILSRFHDKVTVAMSKSSFVENVLIAKIRLEDGEKIDCIYCTVLRNALVWGLFGFVIGTVFGNLLCR